MNENEFEFIKCVLGFEQQQHNQAHRKKTAAKNNKALAERRTNGKTIK